MSPNKHSECQSILNIRWIVMISSGCVPCHSLQQQTEDVKPEGNIDHSAIWVAQDLKVILFKFLNVPYRERYSIETPEELKISISELKQTVLRQANRKEQQMLYKINIRSLTSFPQINYSIQLLTSGKWKPRTPLCTNAVWAAGFGLRWFFLLAV